VSDSSTKRSIRDLGRIVVAWGLNLITVVVLIFLVVSAVRTFFFDPSKDIGARHRPAVGSSVSLPNVNWEQNKRTLVIAIQTSCQFCESSLAFYQELIRSNNTAKKLQIFMVFPESLSEARQYLREHSLDGIQVRQAEMSRLRIPGTPTLLLVNESGRLEAGWFGKLSAAKEMEVLAKLSLKRSAEKRSPMSAAIAHVEDSRAISAQSFAKQNRRSPILDIRPRDEFRAGHIAGALNIPRDELEARALHEMPTAAEIVVYCNACTPCINKLELEGALSFCLSSLLILQKLGFSHFRFLRDDLESVEAAGIAVARTANASSL